MSIQFKIPPLRLWWSLLSFLQQCLPVSWPICWWLLISSKMEMQEMHSYLQVATKLAAYIVSLVLSYRRWQRSEWLSQLECSHTMVYGNMVHYIQFCISWGKYSTGI